MRTKDYSYEEYKDLIEKIYLHEYNYYVLNKSVISDYEFDQLYQTLLSVEEQHPEWITEQSPSQRVGGIVQDGFSSFVHPIPLQSLSNAFSYEDLKSFDDTIKKELGSPSIKYSVEYKIDGLSIALYYQKGVLHKAVTRGDGINGEDVTLNVKTIKGIPLEIPYKTKDVFLRGEIYMSKQSFNRINQEREQRGLQLFQNPRNAASGSIRQLDTRITASRNLDGIFYTLLNAQECEISNQMEAIDFIKKQRLAPVYHEICDTIESVYKICQYWEDNREKLPYEIDGMVVKIVDFSQQQRLGSRAKTPRWAIAYKFKPEQQITKLNNIVIQIGRTGVATPVGELEPIKVAGSLIKRATLHNLNYIKEKDIRVGDYVIIQKAGDVIPEIAGVLYEKRTQDQKTYIFPETCPECGSTLVHVEGEAAIRCPNSLSCPAQVRERIAHFVSKNAMDISGLGGQIVNILYEKGLIKDVSDIYKLNKDELIEIERFGKKSVEKLLSAIDDSKKQSFDRFIYGLGIPLVGQNSSKILAAHFDSLSELMQAKEDELVKIDQIGKLMAKEIVVFFSDSHNQEQIARLVEYGLNTKRTVNNDFKETSITGKTFVITGTLAKHSRDEMKTVIENAGGRVTSSVSKKTDFVLAGDNPGSKYDKALALGISIIDEDSILTMLKGE